MSIAPVISNEVEKREPIKHGYRVLLFKGTGLVSSIIKWQTFSKYSHAAILLPSGEILEAKEGSLSKLFLDGGVRRRDMTPEDWQKVDVFHIPSMTEKDWQKAVEFAIGEIGCGYDYRAVLRFVTRIASKSNSLWFCSEYLFETVRKGRCDLLARVEGWQVNPGMLALSPLMKRDRETEEENKMEPVTPRSQVIKQLNRFSSILCGIALLNSCTNTELVTSDATFRRRTFLTNNSIASLDASATAENKHIKLEGYNNDQTSAFISALSTALKVYTKTP